MNNIGSGARGQKFSRARLLAVLLGAAFIGGQSTLALAQGTDSKATKANPTDQLEVVTVTAQKRPENLQDVPFSVSALTGKSLETFHYRDLQNLNATVPNILFTQTSNVALTLAPTIRGVGQTDNPDPYAGTEVAIVIDGVVQGTRLIGLSDQFDIKRIEVLRGPQGTLFGADTLGGVVNVITRQPTGTFGVYGHVTKGNYDQTNAAVAVNFPLVKNVLAGKVSVSQRNRDGFFTNLANNQNLMWQDSTKLRGYLLFTPTPNFTATLIAEHDRIRNGADVAENISLPGELFYVAGVTVDRPKFKLYSDSPQPNNADQNAYTLNMKWSTSIGEVTSISNYTRFTAHNIQDVDELPAFLMNAGRDIESDQRSEELRLTSDLTKDINLVVGVFYLDVHSNIDTISMLPTLAPGIITSQQVITSQRNMAAYGQMYWRITHKLRLGLGVRISNTKTTLESQNRTNYNLNLSPVNYSQNLANSTLIANWVARGSKSWTDPSAKVSLDYELKPGVKLYAYYARGFKAGGFNGRITDPRDIGPFNPEHINTYEVGLRSDWFGHRLRVNFSGFYNQWDNMQVPQSVFHSGVASSTILNAASATTKGMELEVDAIPTDALLIRGSLGYLVATYDKFSNLGVNYAGRATPYAPKWTASLTASYQIYTDLVDITPAIQYTYVSSRWGSFTQYSVEHLAGYSLFNANVDFAPEGANWKVSLWATNLFDKKYFTSALNVPPLFSFASVGAPRQFGATLSFDFQ